jgi:hypothetical protein
LRTSICWRPSERDAEINGDAVIDTDIARCNTYNTCISMIRNASIKRQSFRSAERLLDRGALKGVFAMLIEQRIAVIAGTNGIAGRIGTTGRRVLKSSRCGSHLHIPVNKPRCPVMNYHRTASCALMQMVMGALITNPTSLMVQCNARSSMNRCCASPETHAA